MPNIARIRIAIAAFVLALAWGMGSQMSGITHVPLAIFCAIIGALALGYIVWESHRTWRQSYQDTETAGFASRLRRWPGLNLHWNGILRPEFFSGFVTLVLCGAGIWTFFHLQSIDQPDVILRIVYPTEPVLQLISETDKGPRDITYSVTVWNLDLLPENTTRYRFIPWASIG
jgi:hypothetical protein